MTPRANTMLRILAVLSLFGCALWGQNVDVAVVVNPKNPVAILTFPALRKLFAGETRTWPGGTPVKLIIRAPGAHEREIVLRLLRLCDYLRTNMRATGLHRLIAAKVQNRWPYSTMECKRKQCCDSGGNCCDGRPRPQTRFENHES